MLSKEKTLKNGKDLCKFVTKRTGTEPVSRCNKVLANYRPDADFSVSLALKISGSGNTAKRTLTIVGKQISTGRTLYSRVIAMPISPKDLVERISEADARCEGELRLGYGQQAAGTAALRH